jgi:hypothetical protein
VITSRRDDLRAGRPVHRDDLGAAFADPCAVLAVVIADAPCRQSAPRLARTRHREFARAGALICLAQVASATLTVAVLQHLEPGGQVCSGFLSPLGRAVLPVASTGALGAPGRDAAPVWPGAQFAPTGQVASGFCWVGGGLGDVVVCADAAPPSAAARSRLIRNFGMGYLLLRRAPSPPYAAHGQGDYLVSASIR